MPTTIAVTFDLDRPNSRGIMEGVVAVTKRERWRLLVTGSRLAVAHLTGIDGIIGWVSPQELALREAVGCPYVCISQQGPGLGLPTVLPDNDAIGRLVAEALIGRGFRHLGSFLTLEPVMSNARARDAAFERAALAAGLTFDRFTHGPRTTGGWSLPGQLADLRDWLASAAAPIGVLASDDEHGWRLLLAAKDAGLAVPGGVAVVGVENNAPFCDFCDPPLASVDVNQRAIGEAAATLMRRLLHAQPPPDAPLLVPPIGLVWRGSCDAQVVDDTQVTRMLAYIRGQIEFGVRAGDVAEAFGLSVRTLDRHMIAQMGHPTGEIIRQTRLERALRLIRETDRPMIEVAVACGFGHLSQLSREVKRMTGQTPTQHRHAASVQRVRPLV